MIGEALTVVNFTMHEKIMHRYAQCTTIWKKSYKSPSFTYGAFTMTSLRKTIDINFLNHLNYKTQLVSHSFLTLLTKIRIWNNINYVKIHLTIQLTNQNIPHLHAFISYVDLVWSESLWRHKVVGMYVTHKTINKFSTMHGSLPLALERFWQISTSLWFKTI